MSGKRVKFAVKFLYVDRHMWHCLGTVNEYRDVQIMRLADDVADRVYGAKCVRDVAQRQKPNVLGEQLINI